MTWNLLVVQMEKLFKKSVIIRDNHGSQSSHSQFQTKHYPVPFRLRTRLKQGGFGKVFHSEAMFRTGEWIFLTIDFFDRQDMGNVQKVNAIHVFVRYSRNAFFIVVIMFAFPNKFRLNQRRSNLMSSFYESND